MGSYAVLVPARSDARGFADAPNANTAKVRLSLKDAVLLPEGPSFWAFLFPVPWLLVHRLWQPAFIVIAVLVVSNILTSVGAVPSVAVSLCFLVVAIVVAFDGREWTIVSRETRGDTRIGSISAESMEEANDKWSVTSALNTTAYDPSKRLTEERASSDV